MTSLPPIVVLMSATNMLIGLYWIWFGIRVDREEKRQSESHHGKMVRVVEAESQRQGRNYQFFSGLVLSGLASDENVNRLHTYDSEVASFADLEWRQFVEIKPVLDWLGDHDGAPWTMELLNREPGRPSTLRFRFNEPNDAIAFKLRWIEG